MSRQTRADGDQATPAAQIGARVRTYRTNQGLTMRELARRAEVSQPYVSQLEHGDLLPSIPSLYRLAAALGITASKLLPDLSSVPDSSLSMPTGSAGTTQRVLAGGSGRGLHVHEITIAPKTAEDGWFNHSGEEVAVAMEGRPSWENTHGVRHALPAGGALVIDTSTPHRWRNDGDLLARIILICADSLSAESEFHANPEETLTLH
ncbi:helix-turn-helix domain-containing protein [Kineococcus sp. SYSU DK003]|uniref:helix-turn-helix domain-containing protein n=1 Tax=Kineococcus sp. SYSU DK003 TaxID=3383124 RepID=UPI003D7CCDE7